MIGNDSSKARSTKTRIEKSIEGSNEGIGSRLRKLDPRKQGLKTCEENPQLYSEYASKARSTKTRIETQDMAQRD